MAMPGNLASWPRCVLGWECPLIDGDKKSQSVANGPRGEGANTVGRKEGNDVSYPNRDTSVKSRLKTSCSHSTAAADLYVRTLMRSGRAWSRADFNVSS